MVIAHHQGHHDDGKIFLQWLYSFERKNRFQYSYRQAVFIRILRNNYQARFTQEQIEIYLQPDAKRNWPPIIVWEKLGGVRIANWKARYLGFIMIPPTIGAAVELLFLFADYNYLKPLLNQSEDVWTFGQLIPLGLTVGAMLLFFWKASNADCEWNFLLYCFVYSESIFSSYPFFFCVSIKIYA